MLTGKNIPPQKAVEYFVQGYYQEGTSRWFGRGAKKLGLSGAVNDEQVFDNIVQGRSPDGKKHLCARTLDASSRRAATDFTFSAPKSVSLQALVGGDSRLVAAHTLAVEKTLFLIEERYAHTRVTTGEELGFTKRQIVNTGNLVVAQFDHIESRELDPHLHTHALVMNMTQLQNGEWYSHTNDAIFANKKFLGMVYQHYLALEVQKLGYEIEPRKHGQFEIKGYTEVELVEFSKRRQQILNAVSHNSSWVEREKAWEATRKRKEKVQPDELLAKWRLEAEALGITIVQPGEPKLHQPQSVSPKNLEEAIAHCSERKVAFSQEELERFVLTEGIAYDVTQLEPLIKDHPELIRIAEPTLVRFTTYAALQRELATIRLMQQGQGVVTPIAHPEIVENYLQTTQLNSDQRTAVQFAATTTDQFIAWQGVAGAGKTFALHKLKAIAERAGCPNQAEPGCLEAKLRGEGSSKEPSGHNPANTTNQGYSIKGFAPSAQAAKELGTALDIQAETVARLLISEQSSVVEANQIWIVDEAGLLSAKDAHALLQKATQEKARVILVGDTKQLSAVEAGNPFKSLQQAGIKTAYLNESSRQRTPELKLAVDLIASGRVEAGFERLLTAGCITEVTASDKIEAITSEYIAASPEQRALTLVLAGTNAERLLITQAIRDRLKAEGNLGTSANITQLIAKDLTKVQMCYTHNFEIGDVVIPMFDYKRRGLNKGEFYEVVGKTDDTLTLKAPNGQQCEVDPKFRKAVYQRQSVEIAVGDRLKWTKNNRILERRNGQEFVVTAIEGDSATLSYFDGSRTETINLAKAQHLNHALVSTTYGSQGKTANRVLIAADYTIGKESFYVAVSRAKYELKLFTEDKERLLEQALQTRSQENPLEILKRQYLREQVAQSESVATSPVLTEKFLSTSQSVRQKKSVSPPSEEVGNISPVPIEKQPKRRVANSAQPQSVVAAPVKRDSLQPACKNSELNNTLKPVTPKPPEWLIPGKRVYYQNHGWGEVQTISGSSLKVKLDNGEQKHILQWKDVRNSKLIIPEPTLAFWVSGSVGDAPAHIDAEHWRELVEGSAIHPEIATCNFKSLRHDPLEHEHSAWSHLFYSDKLQRTNSGRLSSGMLSKYTHIEAGGWWCDAGVDPRSFQHLQPGHQPERKIWGCYKPNTPRENPDKPGNKIKYEHPPKTDLSIFLLDVPDDIAERIYEKALVKPTQSDRASGFWYCVWKYNLSVTITEGAKKAACLLSQGHAAIGLPGIYAGYRSNASGLRERASLLNSSLNRGALTVKPGSLPSLQSEPRKDDQGQEIKARLMDELAVFATPEREINICFDYETRPESKRNIDIAISRTGELLEHQGAKVNVVKLPGSDKGVDDFIVAQGGLAYEKLHLEAKSLKAWRNANRQQRLAAESQEKLSPCERFELLKAKFKELPNPEQEIQSPTVESKPNHPEQKEIQPTVESNISLSEQEIHLLIVEELNQFSNRDLWMLSRFVQDYFNTEVSPLVAEADKQFIQSEIDRLAQLINHLWTQQTELEKLIESMRYNPFRIWSKKYSDALAQLQQTLSTIGQSLAQKEQFEQRLIEWSAQEKAHQAWENEPRTLEMKRIAQALKSPHIQERLTSIKLELQWHQQQQQTRRKLAEFEQEKQRSLRGFRL